MGRHTVTLKAWTDGSDELQAAVDCSKSGPKTYTGSWRYDCLIYLRGTGLILAKPAKVGQSMKLRIACGQQLPCSSLL